MEEPKNTSLTKAMRNALVTGAPASLERLEMALLSRPGLTVGDVHYRLGITNSHRNVRTALPTTIEAVWKGLPITREGNTIIVISGKVGGAAREA